VAINSSETSVLKRAVRRHIPEGGILLSRRRENLKYYVISTETEQNDICIIRERQML
jgi:hypothetical protein